MIIIKPSCYIIMKSKLVSIVIVLLSVFFATGCDKESTISEQQIPREIKDYISLHFPNSSISRCVKDDGDDELYEVTLTNGYRLGFNSGKLIVDIDGNTKLPDSVVPASLLAYIGSHYPGNYSIGWEIEMNTQKLQLNNNLLLVFSMTGDFLRIGN